MSDCLKWVGFVSSSSSGGGTVPRVPEQVQEVQDSLPLRPLDTLPEQESDPRLENLHTILYQSLTTRTLAEA